MDNNFSFRATMRPDEELRERVDNREKYLPETVEASVEELKIRGIEFSEDQERVITEDMQTKRQNAESGMESFGLFNGNGKQYHVTDPDAPLYYSKQAIVGFSVFFSVLFGSVMLAINVAKNQTAGKASLVILFGLCYTILTVILAQQINLPTYFSVVIGMIGANLMEIIFWRKYLGKSVFYRPKPIWIPLIIGIAILIPIVYLIINYGKV